jgi:hypothetical protein
LTRCAGAGGGDQCEGPPNGDRDRRCIAVDGEELAAGPLGARRGDAAHCVHHRTELADAVDTRTEHLVMPSPPTHQPNDIRPFSLALGQDSPRLLQVNKSASSRTANPIRQRPMPLVQPVTQTHPARQSDWGGPSEPTSPI